MTAQSDAQPDAQPDRRPDLRPDAQAATPSGAGSADALLPAEVRAFLQSGLSIALGAHDPQEGPVAGLAVGARALDGGRLRLTLHRAGHEPLLLALMRHARVAATFTRPADHRSVQVKGDDAAISAPSPDDVRAARTQRRAFERELLAFGHAPAFAAAFNALDPADLVAIEFVPRAAFAQSPGPGAGAALAR